MTLFTDTLAESLSFTVAMQLKDATSIKESFTALDVAQPGWKLSISDSVSFNEAIFSGITVTIDDILIVDAQIKLGSSFYTVAIAEQLDIIDFTKAGKAFNDLVAESLSCSDSLLSVHKKIELIAEVLIHQDSVTSTGVFLLNLNESLKFSDALKRAIREILNESFTLTDSLVNNAVLLSPISDSFSLNDVLVHFTTGKPEIKETLTLADVGSSKLTAFITVDDELFVRAIVNTSAGPHVCWVISTKQNRPSLYSNFDFNSFAAIDNQLYGARDDGIYLLEGSDDAGTAINTGVFFDLQDSGVPNVKRVRSVYVGSDSDTGTVQIKSDRGDKGTYDLTNKKAIAGRDIKGKKLLLYLENLKSLENVEVNIIVLPKNR